MKNVQTNIFPATFFWPFIQRKPIFAGIIMQVAFVTTTFAAEPLTDASLSEEDFLADIPIVLTATRLAQPVNEAPAAMTIIDRQMIKASGARNIADIFKIVPGFQVQYENGHTPIVTYHGMSDQFSRRLQVLVDGRSVYTPVIGGVEWSQLPLVLDDIERIEVTRGPNAASYGANAFTAIINIITQHSSESSGVYTRLTVGSPGEIVDSVMRFGAKQGDVNYRLTLAYSEDDGFPDRYDRQRARIATFRADYDVSTRDTIQFQAGYNDGPRGLDSGDPNIFPERVYNKETENQFQQIRWNHNFSSENELQLQYYHNSHKAEETPSYDLNANEANDFFGIPPVLYTAPIRLSLDNSVETERHDIELQYTSVLNDKLRIISGGSIRQDQWYAPGLITSNEKENVNWYRVFINGEWRTSEKTSINAGAMLEKNDLTGESLSPRLAFLFFPDGQNSLRAVVSKATRAPTLIEYDGEIISHFSGNLLPGPVDVTLLKGTTNITNETITSYEIGLNSHFKDIGLATDIKLFSDEIKDIIHFNATSGMAVPANSENATLTGIELQADLKTTDSSRIFFAYSHVSIKSDDIFEGYSKTAPKNNMSILYSKEFSNKILASLTLYNVSESNGLESGDDIPSRQQVDIRIAIPFKATKLQGEFAFVSQNISGNEYNDWRNDNIMGSRQFFTVTAQID